MSVPEGRVDEYSSSDCDGQIISYALSSSNELEYSVGWMTKEPLETLRDALDEGPGMSDEAAVGIAQFSVDDGYENSTWGALKRDGKFEHVVFFYTGPEDGTYEVDWSANDIYLAEEGESREDEIQEEDVYNTITLTVEESDIDIFRHYFSETTDLDEQEVDQYVERLADEASL